MLGTLSPPPVASASSLSDAAVLLREADRLIARAVSLIAASRDALAGLSPRMRLMLDAHGTRSDARALVHAASVLEHMPILRGRFAR